MFFAVAARRRIDGAGQRAVGLAWIRCQEFIMVQLIRRSIRPGGAAALLSAAVLSVATAAVFATVIDQTVVVSGFTSTVIMVAASLLVAVRTPWLLTNYQSPQVAMVPVVARGRVSGGKGRSSG